jgi:epoxyqueuosine reductase
MLNSAGGTSMELVANRISDKLLERGCLMRIVAIEHTVELQKEIMELHDKGMFNEEFYESSLSSFKFDYRKEFPKAKSIIVVAIPYHITKLNFLWEGKISGGTIPPTYISEKINKLVYKDIEIILNEEGYEVIRPKRLPLKLLSARCGLSKYGRNNITYVPDMGSFYGIQAFYTDLKCEPEKDSWQEAENMPNCSSCNLCVNICPTGCIYKGRFLLHAEDCLTNMNENEEDFPEWVDNKWHNSLVGCMECQMVCPQNKDHIKIVEVLNAFTEEDISAILKNVPIYLLQENTIETLRKYELLELYKDNVLSRNLRVLLNKDN